MPQTAGATTLVGSSRPPSPVSTTAHSTPCRAKEAKASAVIISNVLIPGVASNAGRNSASSSTNSTFAISAPLSRMRSRKVCRCGEVYSPVR